MSKEIQITHPDCGHQWTVTYESLQQQQTLYKGLHTREAFHITCPNCQDEFIISIPETKGDNQD